MAGEVEESGDTLRPTCTGASATDASGLTMLVALRHRADAYGRVVALAGPRPNACELLRITGLDQVLSIYSALAQAVVGRVDAHGPAIA